MLTALIPAARRADRNSRPRGGVSKGSLDPTRVSLVPLSSARTALILVLEGRSGSVSACDQTSGVVLPFPEIFEELPVGKRSLTQNQHSYLKLHVVAALGSLNYSVRTSYEGPVQKSCHAKKRHSAKTLVA